MRCGIGSRRWGWNRDARSQRGARPNSWGGAVRPRGVLASWVFSRAKPFSARKLSKAVSDLVFVHRVGFSQNKLGVLVSVRPAGIADLNFRHPGRYAQETEVLRRYCLSVYLPNHDSLLPGHVLWPGVATGEEKTFSQHGLSLGFNTAFAEGTFYEQPLLATYYYGHPTGGHLARLYLVESFQLGNLVQALLTVETKYANLYVPVSDKAIIQRLQRRLTLLQAGQPKA